MSRKEKLKTIYELTFLYITEFCSFLYKFLNIRQHKVKSFIAFASL